MAGHESDHLVQGFLRCPAIVPDVLDDDGVPGHGHLVSVDVQSSPVGLFRPLGSRFDHVQEGLFLFGTSGGSLFSEI